MIAVVAALLGFTVVLAQPAVAHLEVPERRKVDLFGVGAVTGSAVVALAMVELRVSPLLIAVVVGAAAAAARGLRRRRARRAAVQRRDGLMIACEGLAADLEAGLPPNRALSRMADEWSELRPVADAAAMGADVPGAFRAVSALPGATVLRVTAAAWSVAHRSGAGLAGAVGQAVDTVRAERATAQVVENELAAAHATARLLAALPVGILVLGRGMGGDPFGFLVGSFAGQGCLVLGLLLAWTGSFWLERIAARVEVQ